MASRQTVLILDCGSQYTQLIARRIRESHVYCEIQPCTAPLAQIQRLGPRAIVLSGGPQSVYADDAPRSDPGIFELGVPVLGICYGEQLMAQQLGGKVEPSNEREYGPAKVSVGEAVGIFAPFTRGEELGVWMSHGDRLTSLPPGFRAIGSSKNAPLAAIANPERRLFGIQFHPEVAHTPRGAEILRAFLFDVAGLEPTWTPGSFINEAVDAITAKVGAGERVICGLSGGVDSSVAAVLCHRALGDRLVCIFVDNGLLREGEFEQVTAMMRQHFHLNLIPVDAKKQFLDELSGRSEERRVGKECRSRWWTYD